MPRLLHLADVHLDAPLRGFGREAEARRRDVLDAFRRLPEVAVREAVDAVLVSGDLFDRPRPSDATLRAVQETVRRLADQGIDVFAVPGNHDPVALNAGLYDDAFREGIAFTAPRFGAPVGKTYGGEPVWVYGVAYDAAEEPDPLGTFVRADEPGLHVVLLHGAVPGAPHWTGGSAMRLPIERLQALRADYLALGDLHRFRGPGELGVAASYPGSFAAIDFTESGPRGPVVVDLEQGGAPRIRRVSSGVREVDEETTVDVSGSASDAEAVDLIAARVGEGRYPVVRLVGEPAYPIDPDGILATLEERFGAAVLRDETAVFDLQALRSIAGRDTVAGHVARLGLASMETASDEDRDVIAQGLRVALRALGVS